MKKLSSYPAKLLSLAAPFTHLLTGKTTPALADRLTLFFLTFPARPDILICDDDFSINRIKRSPFHFSWPGLRLQAQDNVAKSLNIDVIGHVPSARTYVRAHGRAQYAHAQNWRSLPISEDTLLHACRLLVPVLCIHKQVSATFFRGRSLASYGCYAWVSPGSVTLFGELTKPPRARQKFSKPQIGMNRISSS